MEKNVWIIVPTCINGQAFSILGVVTSVKFYVKKAKIENYQRVLLHCK